jgi:hypothetical protein
VDTGGRTSRPARKQNCNESEDSAIARSTILAPSTKLSLRNTAPILHTTVIKINATQSSTSFFNNQTHPQAFGNAGSA